MAELYLVRHGQASLGAFDYDRLSGLGAEQAHRLGAHLASRDIAFDQVMCGSQRRHLQTLEALLQGYGAALPAVIEPALNEYDFEAMMRLAVSAYGPLGAAAKGDARAFQKVLRQVLVLWSEDRLSGPLPETWSAFQARVASVRERLMGAGHRRVLAVSSGGAIAAMVQQVLRAPAATAIELNLQLVNSGFCRFFFGSAGWALSSFNAMPHLDELGGPVPVTYV